jgi:hypothetical protein
MGQVSSTRMQEFANDLSAVGYALGKIGQKGVLGSWQSLTSDQRDYLLSCQVELLRSAATITAQGITLEDANFKNLLDDLQDVATAVSQTLNRVAEIQDVMNIATTALTLASAVAAGNTAGISSSLERLLSMLPKPK